MFLTITTTTIATIIFSSEPMRSFSFKNRPRIARCKSPSQPLIEIGLGCLKSSLRNGTSSVKTKASSAAPMTLHTMLPAIRHQCGRRNTSSRRYIDRCSRDTDGRLGVMLRRAA